MAASEFPSAECPYRYDATLAVLLYDLFRVLLALVVGTLHSYSEIYRSVCRFNVVLLKGKVDFGCKLSLTDARSLIYDNHSRDR